MGGLGGDPRSPGGNSGGCLGGFGVLGGGQHMLGGLLQYQSLPQQAGMGTSQGVFQGVLGALSWVWGAQGEF